MSIAAFLYRRTALPASLLSALALAFLAGGGIGSVVAQLLESRPPPALGLSATLIVGLGEELAKLVAIAWLLGRREYASMLHGILVGATAGTGFAAFESMSFALTILQLHGDVALMGEALVARGVLAPLVHGTWAAIVAGVLWRERCGVPARISWPVLLAVFGVVVLHGLWEWSGSLIPLGITVPGLSLAWPGAGLTVPELWLPLPAVAIGLIGLGILVRLLREAERERCSIGADPLADGASGWPTLDNSLIAGRHSCPPPRRDLEPGDGARRAFDARRRAALWPRVGLRPQPMLRLDSGPTQADEPRLR